MDASNPGADLVSDFSRDRTDALLVEACRAVGLPPDGAELLRLGENAIYQLRVPVVVRIARTMEYWADVEKEVSVARWLAGHAVPAAVAAREVPDQPIVVSNHPVTFWSLIEGRKGDQRELGGLGKLLRQIHALERPSDFHLPDDDIFGRVRNRISSAPIPAEDKDLLVTRLAELTAKVSSLEFPLPQSPVHGDAHTGNLIATADGPILIDFERFAFGQPEWDLAVTATEVGLGWLRRDQYRKFSEAYGFDVLAWPDFSVLQETHWLKMTTWLSQNVTHSEAIASEYRARMRTIRDRGVSTPWRPF